jgi:hypothetical protein
MKNGHVVAIPCFVSSLSGMFIRQNEYRWYRLDDIIQSGIVGLTMCRVELQSEPQLPVLWVGRVVFTLSGTKHDQKSETPDQNTHFNYGELSPHSKKREHQEASGLSRPG